MSDGTESGNPGVRAVQLVTGEPAALTRDNDLMDTWMLPGAVIFTIAVVVCAHVWRRRVVRWRMRDPRAYAYRVLCRRWGVKVSSATGPKALGLRVLDQMRGEKD